MITAQSTHFNRLNRVERGISRSALWCQRLATFAVPYFVIVILGHRTGAVATVPTFWLIGLGIAILIAALIAGAHGFYELWTFGHRGGLRAARGFVLASLLLLPFLYFAFRAFVHPPLYDISTDLEEPPQFQTALDDRTDEMNPVIDPTDLSRRQQLEAYPRVAARRYPLGSGKVFTKVVALLSDRDWTILTTDAAPGDAGIDEEGSGLVAKPVDDGQGRPLRAALPKFRPTVEPAVPNDSEATPVSPVFETIQVSPVGRTDDDDGSEQEERQVEAVATSFIFGFESDVVVRLVEGEDGTLVDMRSTSRWGPHDLGFNAERIRAFLADLDISLQGLGQGS